jgi:DUF4097 and DUF4098 domain-containing protein YvlB
MIHTFATPAPITAVLDIPAGRLYLAAADRADTTVEIRPADPDKGRDVKLAEQTTADYSDGTLRVAGPDRNKLFGSTGAVEVTVHLPAGSKVEVKTASVQVSTAGQLGDVTLDSAQATVTIEAAASAHLVTVDGDITVGRLGGNAEIRTARGNLQVTEAVSGRVELVTQSGTITVGAAAGVSATLDAGTTVGRIHNTLANAGTPALEIRATTTVGDITARSL